MFSLPVRNYFLFIFSAANVSAAACSATFATASLQSLAYFMSTSTKMSGRMSGVYTKNDDHFSHWQLTYSSNVNFLPIEK